MALQPAVLIVDDDVAVPAQSAAGVDDLAWGGGVDQVARVGGDVDPVVPPSPAPPEFRADHAGLERPAPEPAVHPDLEGPEARRVGPVVPPLRGREGQDAFVAQDLEERGFIEGALVAGFLQHLGALEVAFPVPVDLSGGRRRGP